MFPFLGNGLPAHFKTSHFHTETQGTCSEKKWIQNTFETDICQVIYIH